MPVPKTANNEPFFEIPIPETPPEDQLGAKKWYKKWWGIAILIFCGLVVSITLLLASQVYYFYGQLKSGRLPLPSKVKFQSSGAVAATPTAADLQNLAPAGEPNSSSGAPVTIVGFFDFECPYSKEAGSIIDQMRTAYSGKVNFVFRNFPLTELHPDAMLAAQAGECAQEKNLFWPMEEKIFGGADLKKETLIREAQELGFDEVDFASCLDQYASKSKVLKDFQDGQSLGVIGTPTWFIEGEKIEGVIPTEVFKKIIDYLLAAKGASQQ